MAINTWQLFTMTSQNETRLTLLEGNQKISSNSSNSNTAMSKMEKLFTAQ